MLFKKTLTKIRAISRMQQFECFSFCLKTMCWLQKSTEKKIEGIQIQKYVCKFSLLIQNKYE